jgi:hypothetical protein
VITVIATASLSAPVAALLGVLIGATATFLVGVLNYLQLGKQLELVRSGQVTDRFTKAVEQLGSTNPQVRMGGSTHWNGLLLTLKETGLRSQHYWLPWSDSIHPTQGRQEACPC